MSEQSKRAEQASADELFSSRNLPFQHETRDFVSGSCSVARQFAQWSDLLVNMIININININRDHHLPSQ